MNSSFKTTSVENSVFGVIRAQDKNLYPDKRIAVPSIKTFKYLASGSVWVRWFVGWFVFCLFDCFFSGKKNHPPFKSTVL